MYHIEDLNRYGANTKEGLARCFNKEDFYLRLVGMALADVNFDRLDEAIREKDARKAFDAAHALKGSIGNLSLTPLYEPICELTELLRGKSQIPDTADLYEQIKDQLAKARALDV